MPIVNSKSHLRPVSVLHPSITILLLLAIACLLLSVTLPAVSASPVLVATCSSWLVAGQGASLHVSLSGVTLPSDASGASIHVQLLNSADDTILAETTTDITGSAGTVSLNLPSTLTEGVYRMRVSGETHGDGSTPVSIDPVTSQVAVAASRPNVFIETDKSLYQPGQTVNFVVIAANHDLKPVPSYPLSVELVSPNKAKLVRWSGGNDDKTDEFGFIQKQYKINNEPQLGKYTLNVINSDGALLASASFNISEYRLPRFGVSVTCNPSVITTDTRTVECDIVANYTYGKMVEGDANITAWNDAPNYWVDMGGMVPGGDGMMMGAPMPSSTTSSSISPLFSQVITLKNGKAHVTIQLPESSTTVPPGPVPLATVSTDTDSATVSAILPPIPFSYNIRVDAEVTETATSVSESSSAILHRVFQSIQAEIIGQDLTFKPGMEYTIIIVGRDTASSTPVDLTGTLNIQYVGVTSGSLGEAKPIAMKNGVSVVTFNVPLGVKQLQLSFQGNNIWQYKSIPAAYSPSSSYLTLTLSQPLEDGQGKELAVGSDVEFGLLLLLNRSVESADLGNMPTNVQAQYVATSRGNIVSTGAVTLRLTTPVAGSHLSSEDYAFYSGSLSLHLQPTMSPQVKVVVWYTSSGSGEIIADATQLVVAATSPVTVNASFSQEEVRPGSLVSVRVTTSSPARVLLTSVDQALELLGGGATRIELSQVLQLISTEPAVASSLSQQPQQFMYMYGSAMGAKQIFQHAGITVMHNGLLPSYQYEHPYVLGGGGPVVNDGMEGAPAPGPLPAAMAPQTGAKSDAEDQSGVAPTHSVRLRAFFPESWFSQFVDTHAGSDGSSSSTGQLDTKAPDSISTFHLYAIAMSQDGIGLPISSTLPMARLRVFQPFFLDASLPATAIRGELLPVVVPVSNYLGKTMTVQVQLAASDDYDMTDADGKPVAASDAKATLTIDAASVAAHTFWIRPKTLGVDAVAVRVSASSPEFADAVERTITVHPEGFAQSYTRNHFIDLSSTKDGNASRTIDLSTTFPDGVVPDSACVKLSITADLMSDTIANLGSLVQQPTGCGEQNIILFAPIVSVLQYTTGTPLLTPELQSKANSYLTSGYARELTFQHDDGSFSAFGASDPSGSSWLTAFVLKSFALAKPFTFIDDEVLRHAGEYIAAHQGSDGKFISTGTVVHGSSLYGGSESGPVAFTSFVLAALVEADVEPEARNKAKSFIESRLSTLASNLYAGTLAAYALTRAGSTHPDLVQLHADLNKAAVVDDSGMHIPTDAGNVDSHDSSTRPLCLWSSCGGAPSSIEATSYFLLTTVLMSDIDSSAQLARWLLAQKNDRGGFQSTQDTVLAIQALAEYGRAVRSKDDHADVKVYKGSATSEPITTFTLDQTNADLLHIADLTSHLSDPLAPLNISVVLSGAGKFLMQLAVHYNTMEDVSAKEDPLIGLSVDYTDGGSVSVQTITPCLGLSQKLVSDSSTEDPGMVVSEIGLFTGYEPDRQSLDALVKDESHAGLKRWEYDAPKVILYMDEIGSMHRLASSPLPNTTVTNAYPAHVCMQFQALKKETIGSSQPAVSSVYAYYAPQQRSSYIQRYDDVRDGSPPDLSSREGTRPSSAMSNHPPSTAFICCMVIALITSALIVNWHL